MSAGLSPFKPKASFADLWHADASALARAFPPNQNSADPFDRSSADAALASHLAFWTGKDRDRMARLMRQSGLYREKYERPDYLARTIANACRQQRDVLGHRPDASPLALQTPGLPSSAIAGTVPAAPATPLFTPLPLLPVVSVDDLASAPPEAQVWWVAHYLPGGHVALLGGHGGAGKSTLALLLAVCVALGLPFMGLPTRKGRVLFFSAEDPGPLVRRRLALICRILGIDPAELAKCLQVLDLTDGEPGLFAEQRVNGARVGAVTPTYQALAQFIEQHSIDVVIVDNASDVFEGDEINRASVRAFIRSLALLVRARGGAVLLLAHVDKATSRAGKAASAESYSGSTAWHNSVRSRLFFVETGPGLYELQHQKSNLGPRLDPLTVMWPRDGLPQRIENPHAAGAADDDMRALLALIAEFTARGEYLSTSPQGRPSLTQALSSERSYPRHLKATEVFTVLRDAERRGLLVREQFTKDRKPRERFAISDAGRLFIAAAPSAQSAS